MLSGSRIDELAENCLEHTQKTRLSFNRSEKLHSNQNGISGLLPL